MKTVNLCKTFALTMASVLFLFGCSSDNVNPQKDATTSAGAPTEPTGVISLARNFYFVFDGSGSMNDPPPANAPGAKHFVSKIAAAKWAVTEFLKNVPEDVNLGLYVFDSNGAREVVPLNSNNRQEFLSAIENVNAQGDTPLGSAIGKGVSALIKQYHKQLGYGEYRLIVITDGESSDDMNPSIKYAAQSTVPIYTIGFGIGNDHALRKHSISYRSADSAQEVKKALEEAGAELEVFDPKDFPSQGTKKN
jgi:Ca-activated chloride channel homolog